VAVDLEEADVACPFVISYSQKSRMEFARMDRSIDWDDLHLVLAVFREGTLSGAARRLGVTHSTVFRRLGAIEEKIGARLFERFRDGYAATPAGETAAASAVRLEDEVLALERKLSGQDLRPSGTVRIDDRHAQCDGDATPAGDARAAPGNPARNRHIERHGKSHAAGGGDRDPTDPGASGDPGGAARGGHCTRDLRFTRVSLAARRQGPVHA
jgi:molybdenum-dependent DNA-binding transcriptional regulator ModE